MNTDKNVSEKQFKDIDEAVLDFSNTHVIEGCMFSGNCLYDSNGKCIDDSGDLNDHTYFHFTSWCQKDDSYGTIYFATDRDVYI